MKEKSPSLAGYLARGSVSSVAWVAGQIGGFIWRVLLFSVLGFLFGLVAGLIYSVVLRRLGLSDALTSIGMPPIVSTIYFILFGAVCFCALGIIKGLQGGAVSVANSSIDRTLGALKGGMDAVLDKKDIQSVMALEDFEAAVEKYMSGLKPDGRRFFLFRWSQRIAYFAANMAKNSLLESCREVAKPGEDGTLQIDGIEATAELAGLRAKDISAGAVQGAFLVPWLIAGAVTLALFLLPLLLFFIGE